jgi:uncharacterized protein DUF5995
MFPYDAELVAAVESAPAAIDDVVRAMENIDAVCVDTDGLKWFNRLYLEVTRAVGARVSGGGFGDEAWLAELDVQFARLYFDALKAALGGGRAPGCWRALFDRRSELAIARIQFALAGINAHINHDLPEAIVNTGAEPRHGSVHYTDYTAVNATLDALMEKAKSELGVRLPGDALPPVSHLEDTIAAFSVSAARETAWNHAEVLWALRGQPQVSSGTMDVIDGLTTVIGKSLLVPVPSL